MSASKIVYRKTAAGLAEMQARRLDLPRKTFSLLLAVDGQRSREQLCSALSAFGDVAAQLESLEEMGLIEDSDPGAGGDHGLRVADASIMPTDCRANLHFTCVMIGENLARRMRAEG